ncbi:MAG: energy transducer TonB [Alphaproteobacteria bacterium]|nr:energy transducer TonB [Alphaproteobacteria bacterium]
MYAKNRIAIAAALVALGAMFGVPALAGAKATPPHVDGQLPTRVIYPKSAQIAGEQGAVELALLIGSNGRPRTTFRIIRSSGHADLDTAALQSAMNWHYVPARDSAGDPTSGWVYLRINYNLPVHEKTSAAH